MRRYELARSAERSRMVATSGCWACARVAVPARQRAARAHPIVARGMTILPLHPSPTTPGTSAGSLGGPATRGGEARLPEGPEQHDERHPEHDNEEGERREIGRAHV